MGSLISDYGLIWDMKSEKEVGVICSGPEVMQNQSPRSPSSKTLTLQCYPDTGPDSPDTLPITGPMPHAIISTLMEVFHPTIPLTMAFLFYFFSYMKISVSLSDIPPLDGMMIL